MDSMNTNSSEAKKRTTRPTPPWVHLNADEEILWFGRSSRWTLLPVALITILVVGLGVGGTILAAGLEILERGPGWVTLIPLALAALGVFIGLLLYIRWRMRIYVITNKELYQKWGIISRNVDQMRIERIQNTSCNQTIIERLLSFGDITIYTAGSDDQDFSLDNVPRPQAINQVLTRRLDASSSAPRAESSSHGDDD